MQHAHMNYVCQLDYVLFGKVSGVAGASVAPRVAWVKLRESVLALAATSVTWT